MERTKGSFNKVLTVASEDGTSCSNSHHAPERTSDVDGCMGVRPENSTAVQTTDPGPLCKAVGATNHTEYDRYPDDVIQDKKLQPESTYQNDRIEVETVDGGVIDLEDCPVLDLSDLSTEHCEWPELKCEGHSSHAERKEITASEPFIDIHSLEQDSGMKQNIEDCIIERNNPINLTSPISQSLLSESHFHNSLTSPDSSLDMIHSTFESGGHRSIQLDLESFEPKNYMLSSETESIRPLSSCCGVYQCEDSWINGTLSMSDSGQNASDISFGSSSNLSDVSHQDRFKDVFQKEFKPDSGFLMNFDFHLSLSNSCYNSGIISGDRSFLKSPGEELIKDIEDNTKGEDEDDFNKEATDDQTFFESPKKSKESRKRYLYTLVTENSDSCEDQNTSHGQDNTVRTRFFSVSGVHHIMFYIIHLRTGQKAVITFHDLEVIQDYPGKTFCTLKSFKLQRGLWLLHHLERLGFLTLHKILPTVGILEPALHGLGGYFQQMEQGQQVTVLDSMQYEWMRVRSFWSFPRNAGVSYLHLARVGFFYTGRVSETRCYSCGKTYREWKGRR
ncbi:uncharacterized protein LOC117328130 isoform X1 [Pecten maximus]|uniref:uncharacterized protein LOC117328130 isoform X1 n=1 Tax=Pecten maximus TaxID=6579 RepID=UPI001458E3F9|nr:uncharacterized protein LOC117328130 isoform X1 [Pecten maximus]